MLFKEIFKLYGLPEHTVSHRSFQFTWHGLYKCLSINISLSSSYPPQSNGQTERLKQEIWRFLQIPCAKASRNVVGSFPWLNMPRTPWFLNWPHTIPVHPGLSIWPVPVVWGTTLPLTRGYRRASRPGGGHIRLQRAVQGQKHLANLSHCQPPSLDLSPCLPGPFKILKQVSFTLELPAQCKSAPTFHVSLLRPCLFTPSYLL